MRTFRVSTETAWVILLLSIGGFGAALPHLFAPVSAKEILPSRDIDASRIRCKMFEMIDGDMSVRINVTSGVAVISVDDAKGSSALISVSKSSGAFMGVRPKPGQAFSLGIRTDKESEGIHVLHEGRNFTVDKARLLSLEK